MLTDIDRAKPVNQSLRKHPTPALLFQMIPEDSRRFEMVIEQSFASNRALPHSGCRPDYPQVDILGMRYNPVNSGAENTLGSVRTGSWTGPPRGKRAPREGISSTVQAHQIDEAT